MRHLHDSLHTQSKTRALLWCPQSVTIYLITNILKNALAKDARHIYMPLNSIFFKRELLVWQLVNINNFQTLVLISNKYIKFVAKKIQNY